MAEALLRSLILIDISIQNGPRLPYEVIALIAQQLRDQIEVGGFSFALPSLAALNRVSKAVHAITLSDLYHRVVYDSSSFAESVHPKSIPRGWKHVKYVGSNIATQRLADTL
jgi:hypothetical protein